ncbi:MAG TPA: MAPEG family protein [Rudaea sp.]|nr:MAPEG family protein [Rudaea sp.]
METKLIWWPAVAMAVLTFVVAVRMFRTRMVQIKSEKIRLSTISTSSAAAAHLTDSRGADNYRNLFELPVLFYLALVVAAQTAQVNAITLTLAWAFVAARIVHSYIQCTYNRVSHRFYAFVASFFICVGFWGVIAGGLLR